MKPTVYLETSIIGYLASRRSRDLVTAANQQITHEWWDKHREQYDLFVSQAVVDECSAGDSTAAEERQAYLTGIDTMVVTEQARQLAKQLIDQVPLPAKAAVDALHIAIAALNGIDYLLTWNCTHIANAAIRHPIEKICRQAGVEPLILCTPQELMQE